MKHRLERVNELIKRELGALLIREMKFDAQLVSISSVDITPDLKQCHVYVTVIGTDAQRKKAQEQLEHSRNLLQSLLAKRVIIKYTPQLHFRLDDSIERGTRVLQILEEIGPIPEEEEADEQENDKADGAKAN
jgi:ribosome-binding factor A